ncbi:right-handed parallel beta-helix repeat-containing protein [Haloferax sp. DFSO52]|uniref:right-handed parallel beta-helix repeat-containing protein n=1 Tax=Haloferax sp. DFSO52 TaxID=3388505 RepID=UPI003A88C5FA
MQKILTVLVAFGVAVAGGAVAPSLVTADESSGTTISSCTTISEPGHYTLGGDLTNATEGSCLQIASGNVTIDGAGHTVAGSGNGTAIDVSADDELRQEPYQNVTVRDVRLESWEKGISLVKTQNSTISRVEITNATTGVELTRNAVNNVVENNTITNTEDGVLVVTIDKLDTGTNYIRQNDITNNTDAVDVTATTQEVVVEYNDLSGNKNGVHVHVPHACIPGDEGSELVLIHQNDLGSNSAHGVFNEDGDGIHAERNYWGASDGPSSSEDPDAPFEGASSSDIANGSGSAVNEDPNYFAHTNVHYYPYLEEPPADAGVQNETAA